MFTLVRAAARSTARGALRGAAAAAGIAVGGIALNAAALLVLARAAAGGGRGLVADSGIFLASAAVAFGFVLAYAFLARTYGVRIALRTWYDAHAPQVVTALEAAARRAEVAAPGRLRSLAKGAGSRASDAARAVPLPGRVIAGWALKRLGAGSLARLLDAGRGAGGAPSAGVDAFLRGDLLSVSPRPLAVVVLLNLAAAAAAFASIS